MRKLINYIFLLSVMISLVYITKEVVDFSKNIISLKEYQTDALIKQERMLRPTVRVISMNREFEENVPAIFDGVEIEVILATATGFSIQYDAINDVSFIITNDHFCSGITPSSSLVVEDYNKTSLNISDNYINSKILYTDQGLDLCLIAAYGFVKPVVIADVSYSPEVFEKVFIVGGPTGNFPIIIDTYISGYNERSSISLGKLNDTGNDFLLISEQIFPGHSGSPVFNQDGEVIGVVFAALETYGGLAISHRDIFTLLFYYQNDI
jgi:S1-C subfamily serine protease